jgi:hypothetical protein
VYINPAGHGSRGVVFAISDSLIVGSNPTSGMDVWCVCVCVRVRFCVFMLYCV